MNEIFGTKISPKLTVKPMDGVCFSTTSPYVPTLINYSQSLD